MNDCQLTVELGERSYPVYFRNGGREELCDRLGALASSRALILLTDTHVADLHLAPLQAAIEHRGIRVIPCVVPPGEASKSLATASMVWDAALGGGIDRRTPLVAFGGGVVGDLGGFAASTLLRGLPLVQVPTTLMAQVDSSIGGKTGLNHARGKNLLGTFHQPRFVFSDSSWLATLPERERRSGLAEAVKHAAIAQPRQLRDLQSPEVGAGEPEALRAIVLAAVRSKAEIVAADESETGQRRVLNFGHTLGHAFEAEAGYGSLTHGEAVSLGMCAALAMSERLVGLEAAEGSRVVATLETLGLPTDWCPRIGPQTLSRVGVDKKVRGDRLHVVLLPRLGEPTVVPLHWIDFVEALEALVARKTREVT